jgi:hypothetical protein
MGLKLKLADDFHRDGDEPPQMPRPFNWTVEVFLPALAGIALAVALAVAAHYGGFIK